MNSELRTIYLNLNFAIDKEDWAAVERATARLAKYLVRWSVNES